MRPGSRRSDLASCRVFGTGQNILQVTAARDNLSRQNVRNIDGLFLAAVALPKPERALVSWFQPGNRRQFAILHSGVIYSVSHEIDNSTPTLRSQAIRRNAGSGLARGHRQDRPIPPCRHRPLAAVFLRAICEHQREGAQPAHPQPMRGQQWP